MDSKHRTGGSIRDELTTSGDVLFRWRSYVPLVLVPLFILSVMDDGPPTSFAWEVGCFAISLTGLALRAFVVGTAPEGASTRGTRRPTAASLSTRGAYSIVRHPLYLANTIMWCGAALLSATWYLPLIVLLLSVIYHERIAAREEAFLEETFGDDFRAWARHVPAMIPAWSQYVPPDVPFQIRRVLVQEAHGLCAVGTTFLVLDAIEDSLRSGTWRIDDRWLLVFALTLAPFLIVVVMKRAGRRLAQI